MGRNSAGTYAAPSADFVTGTVISAPVMNTKLSDLGTEITDSLSRSGKGGMLAPIRCADGSANLPAFSFTAENTAGFWRAGTDDFRATYDGTALQKWSTSGVLVYPAFLAEKGATITNSTSNGAGTTSTGNGTGAGVVGTGGATGNGGTFTGGATSGYGVQGTGVALAGVRGVGGANSPGLLGAGTGTGAGTQAVGGATGVGGHFTGGTVGDGVRAIGTGGTSSGIYASGASGTAGVGGYFEAGTNSTGAAPTNAVTLANGHLFLAGAAPNSGVAFANTLTPTNIPKAWVTLTTVGSGSTSATISDGFNISGVAVSGAAITVTLAQAVTSPGIALVTIGPNGGAQLHLLPRATMSGSTVTIRAGDVGNANSGGGTLVVSDFDFQAYANTVTVYMAAFGDQ